jgi:hypothetical protein
MSVTRLLRWSLVPTLAMIWPIKSINTIAAAWFRPDASTYEMADTGYLIVSSIGADKTVTGTINLQFPSAGHIRSAFRAAWVPSNSLCA